jgi:fibronectin-binding autotransporter adhesin
VDGSTHGALTISAGSTYTNGNDSFLLTLGTITNNDIIQVNAAGNNSVLDLSANTTLNGGGIVNLSPTGAGIAIISPLSGGLTLTNAGNTIQGAGIIGNGSLTVNNQAGGIIDANMNGKTLTLNGSGGVSNAGLLETSAGQTACERNFSEFHQRLWYGTLTGNYAVVGREQIHSADRHIGSAVVHVLGNGTTPSSITLNGINANTLLTDSNGVSSALGLAAITTNASLTVEGGYDLTTPGALTNVGSVTVGGSGSLLDVTGAQTSGSTDVALGGTLTASSFTLSGGTAQVDGTVDPPLATLIGPGTELFGTAILWAT